MRMQLLIHICFDMDLPGGEGRGGEAGGDARESLVLPESLKL